MPVFDFMTSEESFKIKYFYLLVDTATTSMVSCFEQIRDNDSIFGFLYDLKELK